MPESMKKLVLIKDKLSHITQTKLDSAKQPDLSIAKLGITLLIDFVIHTP